MATALASEPLRDVEIFAFGDLFLEDIRAYREQRLAAAGKRACFPLWHRDTAALAREFIAAGFEAIVACVDPRQLDGAFAGRRFDEQLLDDLPAGVDPCGENGEFHTFVYAGPILRAPVPVEVGEIVERDGFVFSDIRSPAAA
jgi:diphthamide synthase (EF-2-diphthine--ammonia ligase)